MSRSPIPSYFFVLVVVKRGDEYLLIHEQKEAQQWYLPAGRVEPGETFAQAARRETLEEGGIPIRLLGVLRIDHTPRQHATRLRVVYLAEPATNIAPKSIADAESLEAKWVKLDDLSSYSLRGSEVQEFFSYVAQGGTIYPLSVLGSEN